MLALLHPEIWKHCQSTSKAHATGLQNQVHAPRPFAARNILPDLTSSHHQSKQCVPSIATACMLSGWEIWEHLSSRGEHGGLRASKVRLWSWGLSGL